MRKKRNLNEFEFVEKKENGKTQEELGKGAFGRVRLAIDKLTNTKVAIKTIPKKLLKDNNQTENMKREIKLHRKLDHAHIVKLYHSLEDDQNVFLVLEYVQNGNLFVYLKKKRKLSEPEAFVFFLQTTLAIDYLHKKGIIHRDLKPENMLLDDNGNIKICDFGWSAELQPDRRTFCGTLDYMCPEMLNSQNHDHRVDIWALGILLFEMLHGYAPFNKNRQPQDVVIKAILNAGNTTIQFGEKLSDDVKNLINSLLKFNPKDRLSMEQIFQHKWLRYHASQMEIDIPSFVYEKGLDDTVCSVSNMSIHVDPLLQSKADHQNYQTQVLPPKPQQSQQSNYQSQQLPNQSMQSQQSTTPQKKPTFDPLFQSQNLNTLFQSTNNVQNFQPQPQNYQPQPPQISENGSTSKSPSRLTPEQQKRKNQLLGMDESKNMQQSQRSNYQMQASQDINKSIQRDQSPNQSNIYNAVNNSTASPQSKVPNPKMAQSQMIINKYTQSNNSSMFKSQDIANQQNQQSDEFSKYMSQEQERKRKEEEFRKQQLAEIQRREEQLQLEESRKRDEMERSRKLREQEFENQRKIREFEEEQKRLIEQEKLRKQREQEEQLQKQREQELEKQRREQELEQARREKEEQDRIRREQLRKDQEQREEQRKREEQQQQLKKEQEERQRREQEKWEQEQKDRLRRDKEEQERQKKQYEEMQQEKIRQQEKQRQQYEEQMRLQKQQEQDRKLREFEEQKRQLNRSNSRNVKTQENEEDRQAKKLRELEQKARQEYSQHLINQSQASQASKSNNESRQQRRQIQDDDLFITNNNTNSYIPQKQHKDNNDEEFELEQKLHNMLVQNLQLDLPPITQQVKPDESSKLDWDVSVIENQQKQNPILNQYENIQQVNMVTSQQQQQQNRSVSPNTRQTRFTPRVTKMEERPTHINNMLDDQLDEWDLGDDPQIKLLNQLMEQPQREKKEKKQQQPQSVNQSNLQQSQSQQQISVSTQPTNKFSFGENKAKQMFQPETVESVEDSFRKDRSQRMDTSRDRSRNKIPAKSNPKYKQQQVQQEPVEEQYDEDQLEDLKRSKSSNQENTYDQKLKQFKKYDYDPYSVSYQNQTQEQYKPRKSRISERQNRTIPQRPLQEMDFFDRLKFAFGCLTRRQ